MIRSDDLYSIAKNCYRCHSVTNEKLVDAGHKIGKPLELISWSIGEVRHNFHENQAVNGAGPTLWARVSGGDTRQRRRVKFIVGILVNLEVSLTALASATDDTDNDGEFVSEHRDRAVEIMEDPLTEVIDALEDDPIEGLADLLETIEELELEDADYSEEDARKAAAAAAAEVAKVAKQIAAEKDLELTGVDEIMDDTVEARGKPFAPNTGQGPK